MILSLIFGGGESPYYAAPPPEGETFARDNGDKLKVGLLLSMFAAYALLWFSGVLRSGGSASWAL